MTARTLVRTGPARSAWSSGWWWRGLPDTPRKEGCGSPRHADLVPEAAVQVEVVAARLAPSAVADIGVKRMAVVGRLHTAAGPFDGAELARDARPGFGGTGNRRPVGGTRPRAGGGPRSIGSEQVQREAVSVGEHGDATDRRGLQ